MLKCFENLSTINSRPLYDDQRDKKLLWNLVKDIILKLSNYCLEVYIPRDANGNITSYPEDEYPEYMLFVETAMGHHSDEVADTAARNVKRIINHDLERISGSGLAYHRLY